MEVLLHIPMNVRGYLMEEIESFLFQQEDRDKSQPRVSQPAHNHSINWLEERINNQNLPEIAMAHASDFASVKSLAADQYFQPNLAYLVEGVRPEFKKFFQPECIFNLTFFMPAVIIMNGEIDAGEIIEASWEGAAQWEKPVIMPDRDTPISKTVLAFLKKQDHALYETFLEKTVFGGSPLEVIEKVASGEFSLGVANQSFSLMSKSKGIKILPTKEGAIPLPQVMVQKRPGTDRGEQVIKRMMDQSIQQYIQKQGAWPVTIMEEIHGFQSDNQWITSWTGWEDFLDQIQMVEEDLQKKTCDRSP